MAKSKLHGQLERLKKRLRHLPGARSLRLQPHGDSTQTGTRVAIPGVCEDFLLRREDREPLWSRLPAHLDLMPTDIETGDVDFDRDFHLVGSPALVLALLNAETRRALVHLRWGPVRLSDVWLTAGKLWVDVPNAGGSAESHLAAIEQVTRLALEVAPLLRRPADLPQRLADNATQDPLPLVRLRNLSELLRNYRDHAVMHSVLGRAARDSEPEIRLRAGIELREGGLPILEALAADPRVEDACSARAVEALRGRVTVARAEELLKAAVGGFSAEALRPQTAGACIDLLGELGEAGIAALSRALWLDEPVGLTAVKALERIGGAAVESVLVSGLAIRDEERTVAIARALGGVGSVAAVAPLMEAARRGGKLKGAARQAIVEIQARTHGTPGQLSLTGGERGGLTLADDHAGQLSLVEPRRDPAKS